MNALFIDRINSLEETVHLSTGDWVCILQGGRIETKTGDGIVATGANVFIQNDGLIEARDEAILIEEGLGDFIINNGSIKGKDGILSNSQEGVSLLNQGFVGGSDYSFHGGDGNDRIVNDGIMENQILLGAGNDFYDGHKGQATFSADWVVSHFAPPSGPPEEDPATELTFLFRQLGGYVDLGDGNDIGYGGSGSENFIGGEGDDILDGGGGADTVYYYGVGITVDLAIAEAQETGQGKDVLRNFENVVTGAGNDTLHGNAADNLFWTWDGNDLIDGRGGNDTYVFFGGDKAVADLNISTAQTTGYGDKTLISIENLTGSTVGDDFTGNGAANVLSGRGGDDTLNGGAGNDTLIGGSGGDLMVGGADNDTYYVDSPDDRIVEGYNAGVDTAISTVSQNLWDGVENLTAIGAAAVILDGNNLNNTITGNVGNNTINGSLGKDTLYGGAGKDIFVFDTKPSSSNVDKIADYNVIYDTIWLDNKIFAKLGSGTPASPRKLAPSAFYKGAKAHDSDDHIIYNPMNGYLYYDSDGTGSSKQVLIAIISKNLKMTYTELFVI